MCVQYYPQTRTIAGLSFDGIENCLSSPAPAECPAFPLQENGFPGVKGRNCSGDSLQWPLRRSQGQKLQWGLSIAATMGGILGLNSCIQDRTKCPCYRGLPYFGEVCLLRGTPLQNESPGCIVQSPGGMPWPFSKPSGLEGVTQSMVGSLRSTLSTSTALKKATDCRKKHVTRMHVSVLLTCIHMQVPEASRTSSADERTWHV